MHEPRRPDGCIRRLQPGSAGGLELAQALVALTAGNRPLRTLYAESISLEEKIRTIAAEIYGADGISLAPSVVKDLGRFEQWLRSSAGLHGQDAVFPVDDPGKLAGRAGSPSTYAMFACLPVPVLSSH